MEIIKKLKKSASNSTNLNKRQIKEILFLLKLQGKASTEGKVAEDFGISRRTAGKDVKKIATFFCIKRDRFQGQAKKRNYS